MGRKRDKFWEYAEVLNSSTPRFKCSFCQHTYPRAATRLKEHLAGGGQHRNIAACEIVPQNIQEEACLALGKEKNQS